MDESGINATYVPGPGWAVVERIWKWVLLVIFVGVLVGSADLVINGFAWLSGTDELSTMAALSVPQNPGSSRANVVVYRNHKPHGYARTYHFQLQSGQWRINR